MKLPSNKIENLLSQAVQSLSEGLSITDPEAPGNPLVYVNKGFERMTGYRSEDILGRNCRFLQGEEADQKGVHVLRKAVQERKSAVAELRNYRKDGTAFWNRVSINPIRDQNGKLYYVGIQSDVTYIVRTEAELRELELSGKLDEERLHVLRTTMRTVHDIVGNTMNGLQLVRLQLEGTPGGADGKDRSDAPDAKAGADAAADLIDKLTARTMEKLRSLSNVPAYSEKESVAHLPVVEYPTVS